MDRKGFQDSLLDSFIRTPSVITTSTYTGEKTFLSSNLRTGFATKLQSLFCLSFQQICDVRMKQQALKSKQDCSFWSSKNAVKFSNISDSVKSDLQKWIMLYPHIIQYLISNYYIILKLDDVNGVSNTELHHKVLLQVFYREIHIDMLKKDVSGFSYDV